MLFGHRDNPALPGPAKMADLSNLVVLESPNRKLMVLSRLIQGVFRRHGVELPTRMKNFESVAQAAVGIRPDEVLVFPKTIARGLDTPSRIYDPNVVPIEVEDAPDLSWPLYLIYRPDNSNDAVRLFIERLQEELAGL